ncbi:MAG: succinyl-diaminopimelate desuccinylase [Bdellovibrionales bacterium]|nr:succinyl-diaminopimelate desuccinylase [Bdellovibrionales bacterium]
MSEMENESLENLTASLVRIESITGNERAICSYIEDLLVSKRLGIECERIGESLVVSSKLKESLPTLGLIGHLDTVPGVGVGDAVRIEENRIVGLGSSDMKGGLGVMLKLILDGIFSNSRFNLIFVFYAGEEGPFEENSLHELFQRCQKLKTLDFVFILEPTNNDLHLGCMGLTNAKVSFSGKRAHSARPWTGDNAIHKAGEFLMRMSEFKPQKVLCNGLEFYECASVTLAQGGIAVNVIPDSFELNVNYRFPPGVGLADAQARFKAFVGDGAEVLFERNHPSCEVFDEHPIIRELLARFSLNKLPKQAYTDVALFSEHGIAGVNFGPGLTSQAHQSGEFIEIDALYKSYEIYRGFLN